MWLLLPLIAVGVLYSWVRVSSEKQRLDSFFETLDADPWGRLQPATTFRSPLPDLIALEKAVSSGAGPTPDAQVANALANGLSPK